MSTHSHTKTTCIYCGNNPTSHFASKFDTALALVMSPFFETFVKIPGSRTMLKFAEYILDRLFEGAVFVRLIQFENDLALPPTDRGKVFCEEAVKRGWKTETAVVFGRTLDVYRATLPSGKKLVFSGLPRLDPEDNTVANWIDDKAALKKRLADAGACVSRGMCFSRLGEAEAYFKTQAVPLIVKPRLGSRGRHTTTHITELEDFREAFKRAKQLGHFVIVEEHLVGSVYRGTMVDGVLAGVLAGDPPRVTGDGTHSIRELIDIKNDTRHPRVRAVQVTQLMEVFLKRFGYTLETVLEAGKTIDLSEKIGLSYGGNAREVTPHTHPRLREQLEYAARIVDDPIIGFDFITPDVSADPDTVRWGIIECNALPFINLHHDPLEGEPVNVAGIFLEYIEREIVSPRRRTTR